MRRARPRFRFSGRVALVGLHTVRQAHGDEGCRSPLGPQLLGGELAQPAGKRAVLATADAQHVSRGAAEAELVRQEVEAALDLEVRVERRGHAELGDDQLLQVLAVELAHRTPSVVVIVEGQPISPRRAASDRVRT